MWARLGHAGTQVILTECLDRTSPTPFRKALTEWETLRVNGRIGQILNDRMFVEFQVFRARLEFIRNL